MLESSASFVSSTLASTKLTLDVSSVSPGKLNDFCVCYKQRDGTTDVCSNPFEINICQYYDDVEPAPGLFTASGKLLPTYDVALTQYNVDFGDIVSRMCSDADACFVDLTATIFDSSG